MIGKQQDNKSGLVFATFWLILLSLRSALGAEPLPAYQDLGIRHVCSATPVSAAPAQPPLQQLPAGTTISISDVTFGPDNQPYFAVDFPTGKGLQRGNGFMPIASTAHFCGFAERGHNAKLWQAPPNSCHLIAASVDSLAALNRQVASFAQFLPAMAAYRLADGQYALSLGLISLRSAQSLIAQAEELPKGSQCVTGRNFTAALVKQDRQFAETAPGNISERLAAARSLLQQGPNDGDRQKQACELGLATACSQYAQTIYNAEDPSGTLPAKVSHYAMLGCMAGDVLGCKLAINRANNPLELTGSRLSPGNSGGALIPELAKPGCDAGDAVSCILLARGTANGRTLIEAASNFAAQYRACKGGIDWACEELEQGFADVLKARGDTASPSVDENYALGSLVETYCLPGPAQPNRAACKPAYYKYRDFLQYGTSTADSDVRVARAKALLERGCAAGDPAACATQSRLSNLWSADLRNAASARAIDLCQQQSDKDTICDTLGAALATNLPAAGPAQRTRYDSLVKECHNDPGANGAQACNAALEIHRSLNGDANEVETMLRSACTAENNNGCLVLAGMLAQRSGYDINDPRIFTGSAAQSILAPLQTGCRFDDSPASSCRALADGLAATGDVEAAMDVYGKSCAAQMLHAEGRLQNVASCYDAAKFALARKIRYGDALQWAEFACQAADSGLSPYGCKLVGNIHAQGLGVPVSRQEAMIAYQQGCFHPHVTTTDGESCLNYGTLLLSAQKQRAATGTTDVLLPGDAIADNADPAAMVTEASRAFDMGCIDTIEASCRANRQLLDDWSKGLYPHEKLRCHVEDYGGQVLSDRTCRAFSFYQAAGELKQQRRQLKLSVNVWPDGDRTVVYQKDGVWLLNEVTTSGMQLRGSMRCWRNPLSKKSFCVSPGA